MSYHATTQKARKQYMCAGHYIEHPIYPGELYVRVRWMPEPGFDGFAQHDVMFRADCYDEHLLDVEDF